MDTNQWFDQAFDGCPVMAILRGFGSDRTVELAERAWDLGMNWVEVPIQSAGGVAALAATVAAGRKRGKSVGAGTVTTLERVRQAAGAGAAFTVAPGFDPAVLRASVHAGLPHLPGVATPTDVQLAEKLGLRWFKAFPFSLLGPGWLRAIRGPFPAARFVATGGVDATNAREFLTAGASVVGVGSALEDAAQLDQLAALAVGRH